MSRLSTHDLTDRMVHALLSVAESGNGVAVRRGTAEALVRRGLAVVSGDAIMGAGVTVALTRDGLELAREITQDAIRQRETYARSTGYYEGVLATIERRLERCA